MEVGSSTALSSASGDIIADEVFYRILQLRSYWSLPCDHGLHCIAAMSQCENNDNNNNIPGTFEPKSGTMAVWPIAGLLARDLYVPCFQCVTDIGQKGARHT